MSEVAVPAGLFELMLPATGSAPQKAQQEDESSSNETEEETTPSHAIQTNLAALLHTRPSLPDPLPTELVVGTLPPPGSTAVLDTQLKGPERPVAGMLITDPPTPGENQPVIEGADFADPLPAEANPGSTGPAQSSPEGPPLMGHNETPGEFLSPAEADPRLIPGRRAVREILGGMAGAKPVRDPMNQTVLNEPNPSSQPPAARMFSMAEGFNRPASDASLNPSAYDLRNSEGEVSEPTPAIEMSSLPAQPRPTMGTAVDQAMPAFKPVSPAAVVAEVGLGLERLQQVGDGRLDLRLSLEGGGHVRINLHLRDGTVHAAFHTDSVELREALQHGWSQLVTRSEGLGMVLAEPAFKSPVLTSANPDQQESRDRRHEPQPEPVNPPSYPFNRPARRADDRSVAASAATNGLNVWA